MEDTAYKKIHDLNLSADKYIFIFDKFQTLVAIEDDKHNLVPLGTIDSNEFIESFSDQKSITSGILNKNCIFYSRKVVSKEQTQHLFVFESNPMIISMQDASRESHIYDIALPYVQGYICVSDFGPKGMSVDRAYISCTQIPISHMSDKIYDLPVTNLYEDSSICWGGGGDIQLKHNESISNFAFRAFNSFFTMQTNTDLNVRSRHRRISAGEWTMPTWAHKTKTDPNFIMKCKLPTHLSKTFGDLIMVLE